ncbi:MAG TPA: CocE/NonD family hydrolase [Mycobacteriales bacterium]|nr:CocE/NonD family hydrolase [Mycobacteriales bacterium]
MPRHIALRTAAAASLLGGLALVAPSQAAPVDNKATWTQTWFPSGDGTMLHADVLLPKARKDGQKHPVILSIGPYFGSGSEDAQAKGPSDRFKDLQRDGRIYDKGYAFVMVDSRGYGGSDGCFDLGGKGEQMDAKAAVEWAAKAPWSTGKVGMWGKSYDAWTQVMALAMAPKGLAATVIQAPINEGYKISFENGVHWDAGWYITPALYAQYDLTPPSIHDSPPEEFLYPAKGTATGGPCYATTTGGPANPDEQAAYWKERSLVSRAVKSKVPVLWAHGFNDVNTKPTNIFDVYTGLKGPKRAWFGQWDHVRGNEDRLVGREGFMDEAMNWFDHYLKGKPLKKYPKVEIQDGQGKWRKEAAWPPADAVARSMPVKAGTYVDQRGNSASAPVGGTWSVSQPAPHETRLAGLARLSVVASTSLPTGGNLIATLYDVAEDNTSRRITRGAFKLPASGESSFSLWPQDWGLAKGHRLALHLAGDDMTTYQPTYTMSTVTIQRGTLSLPLVTFQRPSDLAGDEASAMSAVEKPTLSAAALAGRDVKVDFGKPLRRR